jgi:hypothetical protein
MTEDEELDPEKQAQDDRREAARRALKGPGGSSEKALGLEMARLFGMDPRLLVSPPSRPEAPSTPPDEDGAESPGEAEEDGAGPD